jgi:hypothetical protein
MLAPVVCVSLGRDVCLRLWEAGQVVAAQVGDDWYRCGVMGRCGVVLQARDCVRRRDQAYSWRRVCRRRGSLSVSRFFVRVEMGCSKL